MTNWLSDGSTIPGHLPLSYTPALIGLDYNASDDEVGFAFTTTDTLTESSVPIPAAVWLIGSGLIGLIGIARRKKA
jgi:hypothetical protein